MQGLQKLVRGDLPIPNKLVFTFVAEFIAEVIHPETNHPVSPGDSGELVLTCLGRVGSPLIRYRTGDRVVPTYHGTNSFVLLQGGVLGRADDMIVVRSECLS